MSSSVSTPTVLVPAAGRGQRFKDAGYSVVKPLVEFRVRGEPGYRTMVEHAMHGTRGWKKIIGLPDSKDIILEHPIYQDPREYRIVPVGSNGGQLDTIDTLLGYVQNDDPVLILNSDVSFRRGSLAAFCYVCFNYPVGAGAIVVKRDDEKSYSFVDDIPAFARAEERKALSGWALAGAYWFRNRHILQDAILNFGDPSEYNGERYISSIFEETENLAFPIPDEHYWEFGTPDKLAAFLKEHG